MAKVARSPLVLGEVIGRQVRKPRYDRGSCPAAREGRLPKLVFKDNLSTAFEVDLCHDLMSVGRGRENDIMLVDQSVSRNHARLERRGGAHWVVDMQSKNGVFVNDERVPEAAIHTGDRIKFGNIGAVMCSPEDATQELRCRDALPLVQQLFRDTYDVKRRLGAGSQAEVFFAVRNDDGLPLALKVLRTTMIQDPELEHRFMREARTLQRLRHPAILNIIDVGRRDRLPFFAIDYLPGGTLEELMETQDGGQLPLDLTLALGIRTCEALEHAHENDVIHRDIKPLNIMFDAQRQAILTDFGIAKVLEDSALTTSGALLGTPGYMSPEQFEGGPATPRSDIFSLGATLYRCLSGMPPIPGDSVASIMARVIDPNWEAKPLREARPDIPPSLADVVQRCLEKRPDRRPRSAGALREILRETLRALARASVR